MSTMEVHAPDGPIDEIRVDGEKLDSDDGEIWTLPKGLVGDLRVNDLPYDVAFDICQQVQDGLIVLDTPMSIRLTKADANRVVATFDDSGTRKYWDGEIGLKPYMEAKRAVVEERAKEVGDVTFNNFDDDGAWIHLSFSAEIEADDLHTVVQLAEQIVAEIEGAAEMRLGAQLWKPTEGASEKEFTIGTVLPILRKLRFHNVRYNHGKREFGRDILFARQTEFQELEHWGAQVKFGDIAGGADSQIDSILGQIDDAFKMPFYDLYTRQTQRIAKLAIIISGRFTENAIDKICGKIESHAVRNNIVFIDAEKLKTLAEHFAPKLSDARDG